MAHQGHIFSLLVRTYIIFSAYLFALDFVENQSVDCLYFQNGFFNEALKLWSKFHKKHFDTLLLQIWNICVSANRNYLLLHIIYEIPDMIWWWNLNWGYSLINKAGFWIHQVGHLTFLCVNCPLFFRQIYYIQTLSSDLKWRIISNKELYTRKYCQEKSYGNLYDVIYRLHLSKGILNEIWMDREKGGVACPPFDNQRKNTV